MKRCPTCTRTFLDDQLSYCTDDGTPLVDQQQSSTFDPQATVVDSRPPATKSIGEPEPTRPFRPDEMPGGWPTPNSWSEPVPPPARVSPPPPPSWSTPSTPPNQWSPPPPPGVRLAAKASEYNPVAIASLAAGVFSLTVGFCCSSGIVTGFIAIILGVVAMVQLKDSPTQTASRGMAIAGIATGVAAIGILMLLLLLGVAFGRFG